MKPEGLSPDATPTKQSDERYFIRLGSQSDIAGM